MNTYRVEYPSNPHAIMNALIDDNIRWIRTDEEQMVFECEHDIDVPIIWRANKGYCKICARKWNADETIDDVEYDHELWRAKQSRPGNYPDIFVHTELCPA